MLIKKYGDIIVGVFFMILSGFVVVLSRSLPKSAIMAIGPEFMPTVIGAVTFVLALLLTVISIVNVKNKVIDIDEAVKNDYVRVLGSFIVIVAYVMILRPVGFILSTIVYLPIQMFLLAPVEKRGGKEIIKLAVIAVVFTLVVFFLFRYGFKIILPQGIFTINL